MAVLPNGLQRGHRVIQLPFEGGRDDLQTGDSNSPLDRVTRVPRQPSRNVKCEALVASQEVRGKEVAERRVRRPVKCNGQLSVLERPLWTLKIDARADVELVETPGAKPRVLVIEPNQVLHVSFP